MKTALIILIVLFNPGLQWLNNIDMARQQATVSHKRILISFSGSDWCGPCIRMKKEIFESSDFITYAAEHLILVRADFPRQKKNQPGPEQIRLNEHLAETYNPEGKFPLTLLLDEKGLILKSWNGFPGIGPEKFVMAIKQIKDAN